MPPGVAERTVFWRMTRVARAVFASGPGLRAPEKDLSMPEPMSHPPSAMERPAPVAGGNVPARRMQAVVGAGVLLTAGALAVCALDITSRARYGGRHPNFMHWLLAAVRLPLSLIYI